VQYFRDTSNSPCFIVFHQVVATIFVLHRPMVACKMVGSEGRRRYLKETLSDTFELVYTDSRGWCMKYHQPNKSHCTIASWRLLSLFFSQDVSCLWYSLWNSLYDFLVEHELASMWNAFDFLTYLSKYLDISTRFVTVIEGTLCAPGWPNNKMAWWPFGLAASLPRRSQPLKCSRPVDSRMWQPSPLQQTSFGRRVSIMRAGLLKELMLFVWWFAFTWLFQNFSARFRGTMHQSV
jgi:hypothetical protein